jgi:hypothetical protein
MNERKVTTIEREDARGKYSFTTVDGTLQSVEMTLNVVNRTLATMTKDHFRDDGWRVEPQTLTVRHPTRLIDMAGPVYREELKEILLLKYSPSDGSPCFTLFQVEEIFTKLCAYVEANRGVAMALQKATACLQEDVLRLGDKLAQVTDEPKERKRGWLW